MKVTKKQAESEFKPVTIEMTFETQREYQLFKQFIGNVNNTVCANLANSSGKAGTINDFHSDEAINILGAIYHNI